MNLTHLIVLAQAASPAPEAASPLGVGTMVPIYVFIFVIFYFLMIRPQQKKQKEHQQLISSLKTGDKVVTNAGIHGIIANVKEKTVIVKVADNVKLEFDRAAIGAVEKANTETAVEPAK